MNTIGTHILEQRKRKGLSQEALSELSNINLRTLQRIEKDETTPRGATLKNLCQALEIDLENLFSYGKVDDLRFITFFHLSVLSFIVLPLGNIILPLILWLPRRNQIAHLNEHGLNLLNFQILWSIILTLCFSLFAYLKVAHIMHSFPLLYISGALYLMNIIYPITISVLISKGKLKSYYFPTFQFIKA